MRDKIKRDFNDGEMKYNHWMQDKSWADTYLSSIELAVKQVAGRIISIQVASDEQESLRTVLTNWKRRCA